MAIENAKTFNVRIKNKYDSYENWAASGLVLEAGEIAIAYTTVDVKVDNGTAKHPALLMKVGDGEKTFANLPWMSARAADVLSVCKNEDDLTEFVNGVIADAGIATDEAMQALAGKVTTAEGKITTLEGKMTAVEGKASANESAIAALNLLVGDKSVNEQITNYVNGLNLADTYAAKVHGHEIADVNGLADSIAAAKKAGTDAASALSEYKTLNDAAVKVNTDAIAGIKNGTTIDNFAEVEEALAGKQAAGNYSVEGHKHEISDVTGLSDAISNAAKAGTDAAAAAETAAKAYADGLAGNYDASGAADAALAAAKTYTDGFTGGKTVSESINAVIANYSTTEQMNTAIATAKGEAVSHANGLNTAMDARVQALEAIDHTHTFVESELNKIADGDVAKWNAAEQNAKDYADGLDEAMDGRVAALEAKFGDGEGNVESQIEAAVAAEAKLRDDADKELAADIKAISDDYLKAADKEELAGDITELQTNLSGTIEAEVNRATEKEAEIVASVTAETNARVAADEAIDARLVKVETFFETAEGETLDTALDTLVEIQKYVTGEGAAADQMILDIAANASAISELSAHVGELPLPEDSAFDTSSVVDYAYSMYDRNRSDIDNILSDYLTSDDKTELQGNIDLKADQTALDAANGKITTLEGEMDSAEGRLDALEGLTGGKKVSDAISEAIEALKIGDYAKAADLTAAIQQHNTDKAALEAEIAKKANDADLAAIAKTGSTDDLVQGTMTIVFDCGGAGV